MSHQINILEQIAPKNAATIDRSDLGLTGNTYSKAEIANQISKVSITAIKGEAITTTSPTAWVTGNPELFEKWDVKTVGTFTNFKNASNVALVVTQADLDSNFVQFWVTNKVSQKVLSAKPAGIQGATVFDVTDTSKVPFSKAISDWVFGTEDQKIQIQLYGGYLNSAGTRVTAGSGNFWSTGFIDVTPGETIKIKLISSTGIAVLGFDANGTNPVTVLSTANYTTPTNLTIPAGVYKIKASSSNTTQIEVYRKVIALSKENKFRAEAVSAENNYSAITGKNVVDFLFEDVNVNIHQTQTGYLNAAGAFVSGNNYTVSNDFVDVNSTDLYCYEGVSSGTNIFSVMGYDAEGVFLLPIVQKVDTRVTGKVFFKTPPEISKIKASSFNDVGLKLTKVTKSLKPIFTGTPGGGSSESFPKQINKTWGVLGHSLWAADPGLAGYQTLIKKVFTFSGYVNYAVNGTSIAGTKSLMNGATWTAKDIYTFDLSTNDFKLNSPLGTTNDFINNTGINTFYGALRLLHEKLKGLNPRYLMICGNATKRNTDNGAYTSWSANTAGHTLTDYSNALRWVSNRCSWLFVDQFQDSGITDDNILLYAPDGLHLNEDGYKRIASIWVDALYKIYYQEIYK